MCEIVPFTLGRSPWWHWPSRACRPSSVRPPILEARTGHLFLDMPLWFTILLPSPHQHMVRLFSFAGTLNVSMTCCPVVWFAPCCLWIVLRRDPQQVEGGHLSVAWHCIQGICLLRPRFALVAVLGSQLSCIQLDIGDGRTTRGILSPPPPPHHHPQSYHASCKNHPIDIYLFAPAPKLKFPGGV